MTIYLKQMSLIIVLDYEVLSIENALLIPPQMLFQRGNLLTHLMNRAMTKILTHTRMIIIRAMVKHAVRLLASSPVRKERGPI